MLKDLSVLGENLKYKNRGLIELDFDVNDNVKLEMEKILSKDEIKWFDSYFSLKNKSSKLTARFPYIIIVQAAICYNFINELNIYKDKINNLLSNESIRLTTSDYTQMRETHVLSPKIATKFGKYFFLTEHDFLKRFLTDYPWWNGYKTIDRTTDFHDSPTSKNLEVVAASSALITKLAKMFYDNPKIKDEVLEEYNFQKRKYLVDIDSLTFKKGGISKIIYGAPGTGKSHEIDIKYKSNKIKTVFHNEYSYFDFVGSYKPVPLYIESTDNITTLDGKVFSLGKPTINYQFVPGPFVESIINCFKEPSHIHTLVIEEINRGNAPAIMGEIFQLMDRDTNGKSEYTINIDSIMKSHIEKESKVKFDQLFIPSNLNIIATMNSADQGVFPLDSAFKRRWKYKYMPIDFSGISTTLEIDYLGSKISWVKFIEGINTNLTKLGVKEDRLIGPYFIKPSEVNEDTVKSKLFIYLWDDILRHLRPNFFADSVKRYSDLILEYEKQSTANPIFKFSI